MTQKEYVGYDSVFRLREVLVELGSRKIFLVTGKDSYSACGAKAYLDNLLKGYEVHRFCEFTVNPKIEDVERGIDIFRADRWDTVIAVGGGSVIDMAKVINFLAAHPRALDGYEIKFGAPKTLRPLIAIPTTSGSGSEATHFAVVYVGQRKHSIADEGILPTVAIVDAGLTKSLPEYITAVSGLDALGQAIESYWNVHSTNASKQFASAAIKLIIANLPVVVKRPTADSRLRMAEAAHFAGKAVNITKTTAAHSISYPLTSYFGIPHGQAVGLTLSSLLVFNSNVTDEDVLDKRGAKYVRKAVEEICKLLGTTNATGAREKIDSLLHQIGLKTRLGALGIKSKEDIELIIHKGFDPERMWNNPRLLTEEALREILYCIR